MVANSKFKYGQLVEVHVPAFEQTKTDMLLKFNGRRVRVTGYKACKTQYMYTLSGCCGRNDVPYWFAQDWIRRLDD